MSIVKTSYNELNNVGSDIQEAYDYLELAENVWAENFSNLYNNIVTSGYLDSLYEDAESNWRIWKGSITVVASVAAFAACLTNPVGWVAIAIAAIGAIFGVGVGIKTIASEPEWYTDSKVVFENLLYNCATGNDDCYLEVCNLSTDLYNARISIERIKTLINEFQKAYADLTEAAEEFDVNTKFADDGTTLTGINTEIEVNGETVTVTTSEAMNAFYTYETTAMSTIIEADYLERTYGIDVDYTSLMEGVDSFMSDTIKSGLYTNEFVNYLLKEYSADTSSVIDSSAEALGIDSSELSSLLGDTTLLGATAGTAGLLGASILASQLGSGDTTIDASPTPTDTTTTPTSTSTTTSTTTTPSTSTVTSGGTTYTGGTTTTSTSETTTEETTTETTTEETTTETTTEETTTETTIELEEITDDAIPDEITVDSDDIDELAREEWEEQFETEDEYAEYLAGKMSEFDTLYSSVDSSKLKTKLSELGLTDEQITDVLSVNDSSYVRQRLQDFGVDDTTIDSIISEVVDQSSLVEKLKSYGYNEAEIAYMLKDKDVCMNAYLAGEQSADLTKIANEIASEKNVSSFDTSYDDDPDYNDLSDGDVNAFLTNTSLNEDLSKLKTTVTESKTAYTEAVTTANESIAAATVAKTTLDNLTKSLGSDSSKWTSEQVTSYNEAVKTYNEAVSKANTDTKAATTAKETYDNAKSEYTTAKEKYLNEIKERDALNNKTETSDDSSSSSTVTDQDVLNLVDSSATSSVSISDSSSDEALLNMLNVGDTKISVKDEYVNKG